jgi:ergothioneine biosynthesis protein EgtB
VQTLRHMGVLKARIQLQRSRVHITNALADESASDVKNKPHHARETQWGDILKNTSTMKLVDSAAAQTVAITQRTLASLGEQFQRVRQQSLAIAAPLSTEDCQVQSMPDASPIKWHLAHTTWFFETFILGEHVPSYVPFDPDFKVLFNSYYNGVGAKHPRPERGLVTRPALARVLAYRAHVDEAMLTWMSKSESHANAHARAHIELLTLGLNHEQQHQELMLTDIKHLFSVNPTAPVYASDAVHPRAHSNTVTNVAQTWSHFEAGLVEIGHDANDGGFAFDNESPRHRVFIKPFEVANRLVTNREFLAFIGDGGYARHELWLSDGFDCVQRNDWRAPLYWRNGLGDESGAWSEFTLQGLKPLDLDAPVCHVSFFEADAYARWAEARLPTEAEWEHAATSQNTALQQLHDDVWQWTASAYLGYPGFKTAAGAVGEYNGKFMCNQFVLRGSSCATPAGHARAQASTYRNFFQPEKRWQYTGIRLAR